MQDGEIWPQETINVHLVFFGAEKYFEILNSLAVTHEYNGQTYRRTDRQTDGRRDLLLTNAALTLRVQNIRQPILAGRVKGSGPIPRPLL